MKSGFKIMDSDMHLREPADLWDKYMEPEVARAGAESAQLHGAQLGDGDDRRENSPRLSTDLSRRDF